MKQTQFELEIDFQHQLEKHPELLAGELIDPERPRKWVLVRREMNIFNDVDGGSPWFVDHLFLDQDAVPTIVEVKRQSDTRIRREAIGQLLEYAASGLACWTLDGIRSSFKQTCEKNELDPDEELQRRLGEEEDIDIEDFWQRAKTNLEAQRIRLIFVADLLPAELRRVVEFLNRQMRLAEVLALELRQYVGENGLRTISPALFGQTQDTRDAKSSRRNRAGTDQGRIYGPERTPAVMPAVEQLISQAVQCGPNIQPNRNRNYIGMFVDGDVCNFVTISTKQAFLRLSLRMTRSSSVDQQIEKAGIQLLENRATQKGSAYRLKLAPIDVEEHLELITGWMKTAHKERREHLEFSED